MLGIPARLAGCPTRIVCSPPRPDGSIDAAVLYAARISGVERVFKLGGAQAVAAMAYGTATVPKVDKIFGPGNTWVTEAKAQVDRDPDGAARDFPAGPSEVLVIADETAQASFVAADLLSQAEHGPDSQVMLVTTSPALAAAIGRELEAQQRNLSRRDIAARSLQGSAAVIVDDLATAIVVSNRAAGWARSRPQAPSFSAPGLRSRSATIAAAPITCCRPTVLRAVTPASASRIFCAS
jgi:histidinol dehydrogenase